MKTLFVCALYVEAKPLIQELQLKNFVLPYANFQVFVNDESALIISGIGKIASASATACVCTLFPDAQSITNFGVCGAGVQGKVDDIFLVDQIIDHDTERTWYPDILEKTSLIRSSLRTVPKPESSCTFTELVDMEASGFFESASHFFTADKIRVIKIVSDRQDTDRLSPKSVEALIKGHIIELRAQNSEQRGGKGISFDPDDEKAFVDLLSFAHFSLTQERELRKTLWSLHVQKDLPISKIIIEIPLKKEQNLKNTARNVLEFCKKCLKNP